MTVAEHCIQFIENLTLVGDHSGKPFLLRPWQRQIITNLYRGDVTKLFLLLSRKNGKTQIAAGICMFHLLCMKNQQILGAAASQEQASRLYDAMEQMVRADPVLNQLCEIIPSKKRIVCEATNSFYCAVTSGGDVQHGYSPTLVVMDELHSWTQPKHRKLHAALTTGFGARANPLTICISTQTADRTSLAHEEFEFARKLKGRIENGKVKRSGQNENPSYLAVLYYADEKSDWTDKNLWKRVNPALGDFLNEKFLDEEFKLAQQIPSRQNYFRQYYLNVPIDSLGKWMDMALWDKCRKPLLEDYTRFKCWGGLDIAPVNDLSVFTLLFDVDGVYHVRSWFWCPSADILQRSKIEQVPYDQWAKSGHITPCGTNTTDFSVIRRDIAAICSKYRVQKIGADRSHAYEIAQFLIEQGYDVEWFRPGFESMGKPTARLEKLVMDREIVHDGNPVMDYCISNVVCESDAAENIRPSNRLRRKQDKIDGAISLIIALGMAIWDESTPEFESVYASSDASIWL
ncbi:terminase large subunit [Rubinisphaera brasiliensis]|uniref:Terminase n=1 Tax=Rubinisphaera brasiliensis (strain ATCC 49424 / DSM 5305 / JCM 21570 / IAM 15109 / NBRC 103401 / IFAM 1448) TaxID=756272 RepID=F0SQR7_RUBBR|nr:terminase TerL endonuclease subunit [Rubinisphaera brasiliensis]ADY59097.1 Terminase [Rubinisphaera brasiliensis DSM 5305]